MLLYFFRKTAIHLVSEGQMAFKEKNALSSQEKDDPFVPMIQWLIDRGHKKIELKNDETGLNVTGRDLQKIMEDMEREQRDDDKKKKKKSGICALI